MSVVLAVDIGTSKICAVACKPGKAKPLAVRSAVNDADVKGLPPGRHEQDPQRIVALCRKVLREVRSDKAVASQEISGIGISGQMHGVLLADGNLRPITNLITWRDQRAAGTKWPANAFERTGCFLNAGYGGATLQWLAKHKKIPAGCTALSMADFFAASMTGVAVSEPTHAASWGIYDLHARKWDGALLRSMRIPKEILPLVRPSAAPIGTLTADAARAVGVAESTRLCGPVGDNQASFIGAAGLGGDAAVVNLGTGGQISVPVKQFKVAAGLETRPLPFGGYILVGASLCGGWSYAYLNRFYRSVVREVAGVEMSEAAVYGRMNLLAKEFGSDGLVVDPRFAGTRGDHSIRGSIRNIDTENLTAEALTRALLEGMVNELVEMVPPGMLRNIKKIVASGNAVRKNMVLLKIKERRFGKPCQAGESEEEAAMGAAIASAKGLGVGRRPG